MAWHKIEKLTQPSTNPFPIGKRERLDQFKICQLSVGLSKDVPLPPPRRRYPYGEMEVGESFLVGGGVLQVVCNANYRAGKRLGRKFIARKEAGGVRVWRIA